jgi:hypothetical protein
VSQAMIRQACRLCLRRAVAVFAQNTCLLWGIKGSVARTGEEVRAQAEEPEDNIWREL